MADRTLSAVYFHCQNPFLSPNQNTASESFLVLHGEATLNSPEGKYYDGRFCKSMTCNGLMRTFYPIQCNVKPAEDLMDYIYIYGDSCF